MSKGSYEERMTEDPSERVSCHFLLTFTGRVVVITFPLRGVVNPNFRLQMYGARGPDSHRSAKLVAQLV